MTSGSPRSSRLIFKRAFTDYFVALSTPAIADPTEAFATCRAYLRSLRGQLGTAELMRRLDDETVRLAGHVEQDLRQRFRGQDVQPDYAELEDRLRECIEHALSRLDTPLTQMPVE
jgi:hypothetical protein